MDEAEIRNRRLIRENMVQRIRPGQPHTGSVVAIVDAIFDISDRFRVRQSEIEGDQKLSTMGRRAALASIVRADLMPELAKATRPVRRALDYAKSRRVALEDPVRVDPSDAVGEMRRQEIRTYLRGLTTPGERMGAANQLIQDDAGAAAILDAPPTLSGLPEHFYGELRKAVAERVHGPALEELAGIEQDYQQGHTAAGILMNDLVAASGLTAKAFSEEMAPLEQAADSA